MSRGGRSHNEKTTYTSDFEDPALAAHCTIGGCEVDGQEILSDLVHTSADYARKESKSKYLT